MIKTNIHLIVFRYRPTYRDLERNGERDTLSSNDDYGDQKFQNEWELKRDIKKIVDRVQIQSKPAIH